MHRLASVLTRLDAIAGVESSSALLADDGKRMIQIRMRSGANATQVLEEIQRTLRAEVPTETPVRLQGNAAAEFGPQQEWLTLAQLNALAEEESPPQQSDKVYWLLVFLVVLALCAFLFWLVRRQRHAHARSEIRLC